MALAYVLLVFLYGATVALQHENQSFQRTIMKRLKQERALDDVVHKRVSIHFSKRMRPLSDAVVFLGPVAVLMLACVGSTARIRPTGLLLTEGLELLLEFGALGLYKQIVCRATRLPPATQMGNERTCLGVITSSWTDYGISRHTGLTILLFLHLQTVASFVLAVIYRMRIFIH